MYSRRMKQCNDGYGKQLSKKVRKSLGQGKKGTERKSLGQSMRISRSRLLLTNKRNVRKSLGQLGYNGKQQPSNKDGSGSGLRKRMVDTFRSWWCHDHRLCIQADQQGLVYEFPSEEEYEFCDEDDNFLPNVVDCPTTAFDDDSETEDEALTHP